MSDWQEKLKLMLIDSGTVGIKQRDITLRLKNDANSSMILEELMELRTSEKAQCFELPSGAKGGRPARIWRATRLILEDINPSEAKDDANGSNRVH